MKKINYILGLLVIAFTISCESDPDNLVATADQGGVIINVDQSSGSILGSPAGGVDLSDAEVTFATVDLDFDARINLGTEAGISKYEIVKTFNGGTEVSITETPTLPFNLIYSDISEYVAGFGMAATDLRIGDVFTFKVKIHQTDGDVYYYAPSMGQFSVVVNCSSSLAGMYQVTATRDDGSSWDQGIEEIIEISPGYYKTITTGGWGAGTIAPDQGFNFNDICNTLTVPAQGLAQGYYSNAVVGTDDGEVLGNGDLVINYSIEFSGSPTGYTNTYVKQ
ncbi:MAG: hypothetical protein COA88_06885 [Kordia sp.]|nr:MAG: hypothetical protein COA88_06885 [Kordia sp.]